MKEVLTTINRLRTNHETFLANFQEDLEEPEAQKKCINDLLRESSIIMMDLSNKFGCDPTITTKEIEDIYIALSFTVIDMMDQYNHRDIEWYMNKIESMKEGE